jgi:hypothetical protein
MILEIMTGVSFTFGFMALPIAVYALIKVMAMEKSTHKIQYVPLGDSNVSGKDFLKQMYPEEDA